jgi:ferritin heavy chain
MSLARHNFSAKAEAALNSHINVEFNASYIYASLAAYFKRDGVALHGFAKYMSKQSDEEREHAQKFVDYVNRRGGRVVLEQIAKPITEIESPLKALEAVLALEKDVTTKIEQLYEISEEEKDVDLQFFLEEFINEQKTSLREISDMITNLKRAGETGVGLYFFDKELSS